MSRAKRAFRYNNTQKEKIFSGHSSKKTGCKKLKMSFLQPVGTNEITVHIRFSIHGHDRPARSVCTGFHTRRTNIKKINMYFFMSLSVIFIFPIGIHEPAHDLFTVILIHDYIIDPIIFIV